MGNLPGNYHYFLLRSIKGGIKLFSDSSPFILSDLSMFLQAVSFLVLLYALAKKKDSLTLHGRIAGIAFILALPSVLYMLYSSVRGLTLPTGGGVLAIHKLFGTLTLIFGLLFVTNQWRWKGKRYMDLGMLCWLGAFLLGIGVYLILFGFISP